VADVVTPMYVVRQRYLGQIRKNFSGAIIIKILNKKGLKNKNSPLCCKCVFYKCFRDMLQLLYLDVIKVD
jgi:hypothetical protein